MRALLRGDPALRTIGPPLNLDPDDPDEVWFVGEPRAETRARAPGAVGADDASARPRRRPLRGTLTRPLRVRVPRFGSAFRTRRAFGSGARWERWCPRWRLTERARSRVPSRRARCSSRRGRPRGSPRRRAPRRAAAPAGAPDERGCARAALGDRARNAVSSPRAATARLRGIDTLAKLEAAARDARCCDREGDDVPQRRRRRV